MAHCFKRFQFVATWPRCFGTVMEQNSMVRTTWWNKGAQTMVDGKGKKDRKELPPLPIPYIGVSAVVSLLKVSNSFQHHCHLGTRSPALEPLGDSYDANPYAQILKWRGPITPPETTELNLEMILSCQHLCRRQTQGQSMCACLYLAATLFLKLNAGYSQGINIPIPFQVYLVVPRSLTWHLTSKASNTCGSS